MMASHSIRSRIDKEMKWNTGPQFNAEASCFSVPTSSQSSTLINMSVGSQGSSTLSTRNVSAMANRTVARPTTRAFHESPALARRHMNSKRHSCRSSLDRLWIGIDQLPFV